MIKPGKSFKTEIITMSFCLGYNKLCYLLSLKFDVLEAFKFSRLINIGYGTSVR